MGRALQPRARARGTHDVSLALDILHILLHILLARNAAPRIARHVGKVT